MAILIMTAKGKLHGFDILAEVEGVHIVGTLVRPLILCGELATAIKDQNLARNMRHLEDMCNDIIVEHDIPTASGEMTTARFFTRDGMDIYLVTRKNIQRAQEYRKLINDTLAKLTQTVPVVDIRAYCELEQKYKTLEAKCKTLEAEVQQSKQAAMKANVLAAEHHIRARTVGEELAKIKDLNMRLLEERGLYEYSEDSYQMKIANAKTEASNYKILFEMLQTLYGDFDYDSVEYMVRLTHKELMRYFMIHFIYDFRYNPHNNNVSETFYINEHFNIQAFLDKELQRVVDIVDPQNTYEEKKRSAIELIQERIRPYVRFEKYK